MKNQQPYNQQPYMSNAEKLYLEHYGVRGMKWGVRKDRIVKGARRVGAETSRSVKKVKDFVTPYGKKLARSGSELAKREGKKVSGDIVGVLRNKKNTNSQEHNIATMLRKKKVSQMTNKELQDLTTRLNLEANYNAAKTRKPGKIKKSMGTVKNVTKAVTTIGAFYALRKHPLVVDVAKGFASAYANSASSKSSSPSSKKVYSKPSMTKGAARVVPNRIPASPLVKYR